MSHTASAHLMRLVAKLLTCYDPRLPEDRKEISCIVNYSEKHVDSILRDMRQRQRDLWAHHIRDIRALGLATVVVKTDRRLENVATVNDLEKIGLPWARYLYSYRTILGAEKRRVYSYLAPVKMLDEIVDDVQSYFTDAQIDLGFTIPVRHDCRRLEVSREIGDEDIEKAAKDLASEPPKIKPTLLDVLLYARLDENPLASMRDLQDVSTILEERLATPTRLWLRKKKVKAAYPRLSRLGLVGRALVMKAAWPEEPLAPLYISVDTGRDEGCAARLYAIADAMWAAASIFVGRSTAATVLALPDDDTPVIENLLGDCISDSGYITSGFGTVIPVEMFSPKEGWSAERQPVETLLMGLGLAEKKA